MDLGGRTAERETRSSGEFSSCCVFERGDRQVQRTADGWQRIDAMAGEEMRRPYTHIVRAPPTIFK